VTDIQPSETPNEGTDEERYTPGVIEPKWQAFWEKHQTFLTPAEPGEDKLYVLDMFPYPSGAGLHVGHPEGYTATDIIARSRRARGTSVLHPMGWDAFGLPAEQHAIKTGTHPRATTAKNIETFRRQLKALGFSYDWSREVDTTDPSYVRWTQWIFLQLFHAGLAYQDEVSVNWCPALGTVLANEEVIDGKSERGAHPVERVPLRQWMLKITQYADRLLAGLEGVDWPNSTRIMQEEWIGRSEGAEVSFEVEGQQPIEVFTTRPDTLFGATFMVLAPEHPLVAEVTTDSQKDAVEKYVAEAKNKSDLDRQQSKEKTGVFTGGHAINPVNGAEVPIWIADYVLMGYGTGAIMAVPAHDTRDFEFAKQFDIPIVQVVKPLEGTPQAEVGAGEAFVGEGLAMNSGTYDGMKTAEVKAAITKDLEADGKGKARVEYKLRDWVFSRQRYWGEPFPIYFPVSCEGDPRKDDDFTIHFDQPIAVEESELPVRLPELDDFQPGEDPAGVLARAKDWRFFQKDVDGEKRWFARETNTMPQWAGSCWYYLRYCDPHNDEKLASDEALKTWLPVDLYVGGAEHAVLHLLYSRFWHMVLHDQGHVPTPEPFGKLVHQGMILGEDGSKMSKSRGNVINPDDVIETDGADSLRCYEMFMGPLEATKPWNSGAISGVRKWLDRCWKVARMVQGGSEATYDEATKKAVHKTIAKVTGDIDELKFNTAISAMMVLSKDLEKAGAPREGVEALAKLVHPFAPHLGEEMWEMLGHEPSIQHAGWPEADPKLLVDDEVEIPVQVNGKKRAVLTLAADATEEQAMEAAKQDPKIAEALGEGTLRKTIFVPKRILNLIIK